MVRRDLLLIVIVGFLMLPLPASGGGTVAPDDVKRSIQAEYDKLAAAFMARDLDRILSFRKPEFETIGPEGQRSDYAQMAEYTRAWLENNRDIQAEFRVESIDLPSPDKAVVRVVQRASRTQDIGGSERRVEHEVRQRETWVRTAHGWKLRMVDEIDLASRKRWVDGVLQPAGSAGGTAAPVPAPATAAEQAVRRLEREWLDAYENRDAAAMERIVADDFTITFANGAMQTKAQVVASVRGERRPGTPVTRFFTEDVRSRVYGDMVVILTGRVIAETRGSSGTTREQWRYTDTYVRSGERWQVVASHLSNVSDRP